MKRIIRELREMEREASDEFCAEPLESDLFEWMFAVRGPHGTDFEGGIYLGRITLPADYPFKPPTFMLLTVRQVYVLFVDCACARQKREREREREREKCEHSLWREMSLYLLLKTRDVCIYMRI